MERADAVVIERWRRRLRDAFKRYLVDCATWHPTMTELRKGVSGIVKAAQRLVASPSLELVDELLKQLELDRNGETVVRRQLGISGVKWVRFKRELRGLGWS